MEITAASLRLIPSDPSSPGLSRNTAAPGDLFASRTLVEVVVRQVARNESSTTHHRPNDQRGETWRITLQAGDRQFTVLGSQKLTPGQTLQLRRLENGQLQIAGMDPKAPNTPPPSANPELTRRILDGLLARQANQQAAARLIQLIDGLLAPSTSGSSAKPDSSGLSTELTSSLRNLLNSLPTAAQVQSSAGLQAAIRDSGLLLETRLRNAAEQIRTTSMRTETGQALRRDYKAALLELQQTLIHLARARLDGGAKPADAAARATLERVLLALGRPAAAGPASAASLHSAVGAALQSYLGGQRPLGFHPFPVTTSGAAALQIPVPGHSMDLALSTLLRQTAATLARIELQQLHTIAQQQGVASEPSGSGSLVVELPVRHGEEVHTFQLQIEEDAQEQRERDDRDNASQGWKFTLCFDFEPLGPMCVEIRLAELALSACLWAERPATRSLVGSQLQDLRTRLEHLGLDVSELECRTGLPPRAETRFEHRLVDILT